MRKMRQMQRACWDLWRQGAAAMTDAYFHFWAGNPAAAETGDRRFRDEAWRANPAYAAIKKGYLNYSNWLLKLADSWQEVDPDLHEGVTFWTRQYLDAISPTNYPWTNPVVVQETIRTGGANFWRGTANMVSDIRRGRISQTAPAGFEVGNDLACTPGKVVYRNKLMELLQYSPVTEAVFSVPILVIPPWINKYYVMDLSPVNSMFKYLVESGFTLFAISWRNPDSDLADLNWEDYMSLGPLSALRVCESITGMRQINMVGYCLGGIMLQTTLAYLAAIDDSRACTATFFATHQDFDDAGEISVFISEPHLQFLSILMDMSGGYLDGRYMAATFNMLRANDLLWHYVIHNYMLGQQPPEFDLLYWNSDGTRVPKTVHMYLLRNFFLEDNLSKPNGLVLNGTGIDIRKIATPAYVVATIDDHIVPWRGAFQMRNRLTVPLRLVLGESGHIAGIINHPARQKRGYWINADTGKEYDGEFDPDDWLDGATHHRGSWWPDWMSWLGAQSGGQALPPPIGSSEFPPLLDAPGEYVLEK